jgi:NADPH-dependent 2,4-dienoyl-CoA reductase/sulfur reductase-like enzyme
MKVVIIGASHGGIAAARRIREEYPEVDVHIYEKRDDVAFVSQTIPLFLMGKQNLLKAANYTTHDELSSEGITVHNQMEVVEVNVKNHEIKVIPVGSDCDIELVSYDKLILATGSYPNLPPTGGELNKTLFVIKTMEDALAIDSFLKTAHEIVVIGGGIIGVELSRIFNAYDVQVTLIQSKATILDKYVDDEVAKEVQQEMDFEGISVYTDTHATSYKTIHGGVFKRPKVKVYTDTGMEFTVDGVIVSAGFRPNTYLLSSQVSLGDHGAVLVDEYMQTSDPDVLAVGDCSTSFINLSNENLYNPHASDAIREGIVAGLNIFKPREKIGMTNGTYKLNMDGFSLAVTGLTKRKALAHGYNAVSVHHRNIYITSERNMGAIHLVYEKETHQILGLQVLGTVDISSYVNAYSIAITQRMTVEQMEFIDFFFEHGYKDPIGFPSLMAKLVRQKERSSS